MVANYLLIGNDPHIAKVIYMKNRPANHFYTSKLSTVRNNIVGMSGFADAVLGNKPGRRDLKQRLLAATGRARDEKLFRRDDRAGIPDDRRGAASTVRVGAWLDAVCKGTDDAIFDEMRNPWSTKIDPDNSDEAVIEIRKPFVDTGPLALEDGSLLSYLRRCYAANQLLRDGII